MRFREKSIEIKYIIYFYRNLDSNLYRNGNYAIATSCFSFNLLVGGCTDI